MNREVKAGYKLTEAGVTPEDWFSGSLGQCISLRRGHDLTHRDRRKGDVPVMGSAGQNGFHNVALATGPGVTLGRSGASYGQAHYCEVDYWPHNTALYVTDFQGNDPLYIFYFLKSIDFSSHNTGGAQQSLNRNFIYPIPVALPKLNEQKQIANALSDIDALITHLDQLIAKKRDIQQAAMQQLLTGQRRLPGFSGEWEVKRLGDVVTCRSERIDPRLAGPHEFCVELEHIEPQSGSLCGHTTTDESSSLKTVFKQNDVLFGKLRAYQRKYWLAQRDGVCSTEIWAFSCNSSILIPEFLYHSIKTDAFIEVASTAYGTHMPRSDWALVKQFEIALPSVEEQTAIATLLSDMDTELTALQTRRHKARQIKQGMMQELLTGRIRLVEKT